jgi:molecular chaperone GrpE (heat shock protein)
MSDPRNVAHDKKVKQEKEHEKPAAAEHAAKAGNAAGLDETKAEQGPGELEKSTTVLSKLKEMEFHSRANIETLAELSLTIEDELKQKEFSEPIGALYSAQDGFQTAIAALIESYEAKCESLKPTA